MTSIRRTTVRALAGFAAALTLGILGAATLSAQSVDNVSVVAAAKPADLIW
jgi:hypothetical protein